MNAGTPDSASAAHPTTIERTSERELTATRRFDATPDAVFAAWSTPEQFAKWWVPAEMPVPLRACEMDVRTDGGYRLEFGHDAAQTMAFYGTYLEVVPGERLVWTNEEGAEGAVTSVTIAPLDGGTWLTFHERYPSAAALDEGLAGAEGSLPGQFAQLDALLAGASAE